MKRVVNLGLDKGERWVGMRWALRVIFIFFIYNEGLLMEYDLYNKNINKWSRSKFSSRVLVDECLRCLINRIERMRI